MPLSRPSIRPSIALGWSPGRLERGDEFEVRHVGPIIPVTHEPNMCSGLDAAFSATIRAYDAWRVALDNDPFATLVRREAKTLRVDASEPVSRIMSVPGLRRAEGERRWVETPRAVRRPRRGSR